MSDEARERLLHVTLDEEVGGATPPDLTLRVLSAARAEAPAASPLSVWTGRRTGRWLAAIAAALLLGVALGTWFPDDAEPEPALVVTSDVPLLGVTPTGPSAHATRFPAGTVIHAGDQQARLTFPSDVVVVLDPGAFVRIGGTPERPRIAYGSGTITIKGGSVPLAIELLEGTVEVAYTTQIRLERPTEPASEAPPEDAVFWVADEQDLGGSKLLASEGVPPSDG